ncbi:MAG: hypothetical protein PVI86_18280 [Phycisphaerae bacterium]|jgi:hypothetical protein
MVRTFQKLVLGAVGCLSLMLVSGCDEALAEFLLGETTASGAVAKYVVPAIAKDLDDSEDIGGGEPPQTDGHHMRTSDPKDPG